MGDGAAREGPPQQARAAQWPWPQPSSLTSFHLPFQPLRAQRQI